MRTSESKTIINQELFDVKLPDYQRIIERLVSKYNVVDGSYYEGLVNFKTNLVVPKHKWYDYKQGYSELLVKHIIDEAKPLKEHYILDPFCGVGTTNLTSVNRGYKTIGFDINPMAILTAKAKTHHYTPKEIALIKKYLESFTLPDSKVEIEGGRVIETSFTEDVLDILLKIRFFVDGINNDAVQDFFRLALISIIDKCSLKIKDGNGLKFKKNYKAVPDLVRLYLDKASEMLSDIRMSNEDKENKIILGSMITEEAFNKVKDMPIGLCVFSPPYANCFDYCEVYKLEFWIGGFVKSYDDFERFRSIALRSHVNSKFSHEFSNSNKDVDTIASLISSFNYLRQKYPRLKAINIANRPQILQLLNTYFGTTLTITDIWGTAGTTVKNLYSYFKNHLSLFEDIIEIKNREICIKPGVNANDIDKLLEIDKNIEKVDRKNLFAIYTEVSSCL